MKRILFSPVGGHDPVSRNNENGFIYDGSMLHIARKFNVDHVVLFYTKEFAEWSEYDKKSIRDGDGQPVDRYTLALKKLNPDITIEYCVHEDIDNPSLMENLKGLVQDFADAWEKNPDDEIIINISSGTPQMKSVLTLLGMDYPRTKIIQVQNSSGRQNQETNRIDNFDAQWLDVNQNNISFSDNRIIEPNVKFVHERKIIARMKELIDRFEYDGAYELYQENESFFTKNVGLIIKHAKLRFALRFKEASAITGGLLSKYNLTVDKLDYMKENRRDIIEFFMILEIYWRKHALQEVILRITPLLFAQVMLKFQSVFDCDKMSPNFNNNVESVISRDLLQKNYPETLKMLDNCPEYRKNKFKDNSHFSLYNMLVMLKGREECEEFANLLLPLRRIEQKFRNPMAHTIVRDVNETDITKEVKMGMDEVIQRIKQALEMQFGTKLNINVYDEINKLIFNELGNLHNDKNEKVDKIVENKTLGENDNNKTMTVPLEDLFADVLKKLKFE
ncbi:MAG: hypothetical protein KBS60_00615 [Phascolarctobacterium sp.]|nr:hypothetical protein [Candidatus Phascolarctobacterium caballi]